MKIVSEYTRKVSSDKVNPLYVQRTESRQDSFETPLERQRRIEAEARNRRLGQYGWLRWTKNF